MNLNLDQIQFNLVQNDSQLKQICKSRSASEVLAIDIETTGLDPRVDRIRRIIIASDNKPVAIIDLDAIDKNNLKPLQRLLANNSIKVFQNAKFDYQFLTLNNLQPGSSFFDTMLASQVLFAGLNKNHHLAALASEFLGVKLNKDLQKSNFSGELSFEQLTYAAMYVYILLPLYRVLCDRLKSENLWETARIEFSALPSVAQMELNGMWLDQDKWLSIKSELQQKALFLASRLKTLGEQSQLSLLPAYSSGINLNSPKQLLAALQSMGIRVKSTNKKILMPLATKHPVVSDILEYRKLSKLASIDLESHIHPITLRIHPDYNQYGARSGRFSCSDPNLQNVPRGEIRTCFVARNGYQIIKADYSQIELRIVAEISGDKKMIQAYQKGEDLHALTASLITGKPLSGITKENRQLAKAVNFGLIYGMGAASLQEYAQINYGVAMKPSEAQVFRKRFFQGYPGVRQWHQKVLTQVTQGLREIRTIGGRRRLWATSPHLPEVLNHPVQGTSADITKIACATLSPHLPPAGAYLIGLVHDEILIECPEKTALYMSQTLEQHMIAAGQKFLQKVPVSVTVQIADTW